MVYAKPRRFLIIGLSIIATVGVAYILGTQAGNLMRDNKAKNYDLARRMRTRQILDRMGTINIGDTLSDYSFEDVDGNWFHLSDLLSDRTVITFLDPGCAPCIVELEQMQTVVTDTSDFRYFLLVSSTGPDILRDFREELGMSCRILFDKDEAFENDLNVTNHPFNLMVNRSRVIVDIVASGLSADDFEEIIAFNRDVKETGVVPGRKSQAE